MSKLKIGVIGGGPAGYHAAIRAAQKGASVVLFEKDTVGGTCLNRGCIPTKTYLKTAEYIKNIKEASSRGIICNNQASVDMQKVVAHKNGVVKTLTGGVGVLLRTNGVNVVKGEAFLKSENEIECNGEVFHVDKIILCGGSKAGKLPIQGIEHSGVISSDEILDMQEVPSKLVIVGAGVIGCEMATVFAHFGSEISIVEMADRVLPMFDEEASKAIAKSLTSLGVKLYLGRKVVSIEDVNGKPSVKTDKEDILGDKVLVSVGRVSDLSCLGELKNKIAVERGKIKVDDLLRTNYHNIFACGDINGKLMLAHAAYKMADVAVENCFGENKICNLNYVPSCIYTIPEAACVGLTEKAAKEKYENVKVGKFNFSANGRALAAGEKEGFVKVIADGTYGEILGVHIVGGAATEMIAEATALITEEITVDEVNERIIHAHPSFSEAFLEACEDVRGISVHIPKK